MPTNKRGGPGLTEEAGLPLKTAAIESYSLVSTFASLFGVLAGFATLVYVGGAAIMALRLSFAHLPNATAVASRLAREVLISVGLTLVVGPALIVFASYVVYGMTIEKPPREIVKHRWWIAGSG